MDSTTPKTGFTIINSGEPTCSFKIESEALQNWLIEERVISKYSHKRVFKNLSLIDLLSAIDNDVFESVIEATKPKESTDQEGQQPKENTIEKPEENAGTPAEPSEPAAPAEPPCYFELILTLISERDKLKERASKVRERGTAHFNELQYAFRKDDPVLIRLSPTLCHGALVKSAREGRNLQGRYVLMEYTFVVFNGDKFVYTERSTHIYEYGGELSFAELPFSPLADADRERLAKRGQAYKQVNSKREQVQYSGNLARANYFGPRYYRADGRAMVDVKTFMKLDPNYRSFYGEMRSSDAPEVKQDDELTLALCSPYLYGFSFHAKQWGELLIDNVCPVSYHKDAFDRVVIDERRKRVIKALVASETIGKFSDIVDGKGGGLIFLLGGPPGVGKTLTAEAIAETLERPIYMVGAGELGTEPGQVETKLAEILDIAVAWNAVLLIDECDIFLEQRTNEDVKRNSLVAVFLRLLEYYPGILFLTTNRTDKLDKAVLSRISLPLQYKDLEAEKRKQIWKNLSQGHAFQNLDFDALAEHDLNGREIKHCLRLAIALADHEGRKPGQNDIDEMIAIGKEFRNYNSNEEPKG